MYNIYPSSPAKMKKRGGGGEGGRGKKRGKEKNPYDDLHPGVASARQLDDAGVGGEDGVEGAALEDVVGAEHELDDVGLGGGKPALEQVVGDVDGKVARV